VKQKGHCHQLGQRQSGFSGSFTGAVNQGVAPLDRLDSLAKVANKTKKLCWMIPLRPAFNQTGSLYPFFKKLYPELRL
jgi:hypothetical protein